jgi:hypothetical protein
MVKPMEVVVANSIEPVEAHRTGGSFSVAQWCKHRGISVSFFYKLSAQGMAPATQRLGRRRLITSEADQAWARANESASAAV